MKNHSVFQRLSYALAGLGTGWRRERSFRLAVGLGVATLTGLVLLRPPAIWCAAVVLASAAVLAAELVNAAVEALADRLHPDQHPEIGAAKDMASAAVLAASLGALVVAALMLWAVFGPT